MVMGEIQAAKEELAGYLPSGKNYTPFTSSVSLIDWYMSETK
jgi:hypothetical protein